MRRIDFFKPVVIAMAPYTCRKSSGMSATFPGMVWLLFMALLLCGQPSPGQDSGPPRTEEWHFSFELFQMLIEQNGLQSTYEFKDVLNTPQRGVIVLMGDLNGIASPRTLERFCEGGGHVLLACDSEYSAGRLGEFTPGPVQTTRAIDQYQGFADCLRIANLDVEHELMEGVRSLIVNRSGYLAKPRWFLPNWDVLARIPSNSSPRESATEPLLVEVKVSETATGRLWLVADQSLFTNGMLWHGDNAILAINMSRLLCEGKKDRLYFVADGAVVESYEQPPNADSQMAPTPPLPENLPKPEGGVDAMLRLGNAVLKNVETSNVGNEFLAGRPRNLAAPYYKRRVLFVLAAMVVLLILWHLMSASNPFRVAMPQREMKSAHALAADRKIMATEFGMAASMLARDLCREVTGSDDSSVWLNQLQTNHASGRRSIVSEDAEKQIPIVLDLAVNTRTVHISRQRFEFLGQTIHELRQLHQKGGLMKI